MTPTTRRLVQIVALVGLALGLNLAFIAPAFADGSQPTQTKTCTIRPKASSCSVRINGITVTALRTQGDLPLTWSFSDPDMGAFSVSANSTTTYGGFTLTNTLTRRTFTITVSG